MRIEREALVDGRRICRRLQKHFCLYVCPPDSTHLLFEGLQSEKLDRQQILMEAHLSVGIGESLEVSIEICSEPLPTGLSFIPVPHAYVLDSILFGRHSERC